LSAGSLYQALNQDRRALDHLAVAKQQAPERYEVHRYAGLSFLKLAMWPEAEAAYRDALAINSEEMQVHFELAQVYGISGEAPERAMEHLAYVLQLKPGYYPAMALRGDLLEEMGQIEEAIHAWQQVLDVAPRHAPTLNNLGRRRMLQRDYSAAVILFNDCLAADPNFHAARLNRGATLAMSGQCDLARPDLQAVIRVGGVLGDQAQALLGDCP
jgi:tetratricopeptide (TPR) repeat protein